MRLIVCLLAMLIVSPAVAQEPSWVGKTIITTRYGIKISKAVTGDPEYVGELIDSLDYEVKAQKGDKIQVVTGAGIEGWLDMKDAVLPEKAVAHFSAVLKKDPRNAGALQKRSYALQLQGDLGGALKDINAALDLQPYQLAGWASRGNVFTLLKQHDRAITDYSLAIRFDNKFAAAYNNRGYAWAAKKQYVKAMADFEQAIQLEPKSGYAYNNRGLVWFLTKEYAKAVDDFDKAEKLDPRNGYVYLHRARMLATCVDPKFRDGKRAVEQMQKAMQLEKNHDRDFHETLAAAHAEAGNFKEAIRLQQAVIDELQDRVDDDARLRLALYKDKKGYRQE